MTRQQHRRLQIATRWVYDSLDSAKNIILFSCYLPKDTFVFFYVFKEGQSLVQQECAWEACLAVTPLSLMTLDEHTLSNKMDREQRVIATARQEAKRLAPHYGIPWSWGPLPPSTWTHPGIWRTLVRNWSKSSEPNFDELKSGHAGIWAQGLPHAERVWYHYTTCPWKSMRKQSYWWDFLLWEYFNGHLQQK